MKDVIQGGLTMEKKGKGLEEEKFGIGCFPRSFQKSVNTGLPVQSSLLHHEHCTQVETVREMICPVCGRRMSGKNLPTQESVIADEIIYNLEPDRIISSRVLIRHKFSHFYDEEKDCAMDDPHDLLSIIEAEFDGDGECIAFSLVKVYPALQREEE
jgi:hypothetical protein